MDGDPTIHHDFDLSVEECTAVPWEEVQLEMQEHYRIYGLPEDVIEWEEMTPDEYFKLP